MKKLKVSLCMIIKNEEVNLDRCLHHMHKFVDEIIIVDTGSTDKSKEIAKKYTDKVFDLIWEKDFSKARNFSIEKAKNDWILVLDADEFTLNFNFNNINQFLKTNIEKPVVGRIERINFLGNGNSQGKYIERVNRFFNRNFFIYSGTIHEQLVHKKGLEFKTEHIDITLEHIGYTNENSQLNNKLNRNLSMLKEAIKENQNDPYYYYQLGKTYYMLKNYENAIENFEKALSFSPKLYLEYVTDLITTYGYSLLNAQEYIKALNLERYLDIYNKNPDFTFLIGLIYMNNGDFDRAVKYFLEATKFIGAKVEGVNSYLAYYNIGVIYEVLGYLENAINFYKKSENYSLSKERLNKIIF